MEADKLVQLRDKYARELRDNCLNFWEKHAPDAGHGGIYTCLDRSGELYNTDKSIWLNGRGGWVYAWLCSNYGPDEKYRELSKSCIDFLDKYGFDADGRMYFTVTEDGRPLRKRRYFFSETFYVMACAEYGYAFSAPEYIEKARRVYNLVTGLYRDPSSDPYKITPKYIASTRSTRSFAEPMILLNVAHTMRRCDRGRAAQYDADAAALTDTILRLFYKPELNALLEMTGPNGEFLSRVTGGRTMNPGHTIEGVWFLLTQADNVKDAALAETARRIFDCAYGRGWDNENGGIYAFVDVLGFPPEALEADMKLWWPTCETLISSLMLYERTGDEKYFDIFLKADAYAFSHFSDPECGEWYGYLHRDGTPTEPACKGNLFKGPFHVPRMLVTVERTLTRLIERTSAR